MTKYSGAGTITYTLDNSAGSGIDISAYIGTIDFDIPTGEQDVTGLNKSAMERLQLLEDFTTSLGGNGMPDSTLMNVFKTRTATRTLVIVFPGSSTATVEVYIYDFKISRGQDGGISWSASMKLANGTAVAWS